MEVVLLSILNSASGASLWRGYDYYTEHRVLRLEQLSDVQFKAAVLGSNKEPYTTLINTEHIKKSSCNCPHAAGTKIICKHIVAVYFTVFPEEAKKFYDEQMAYQKEAEMQQEELNQKLPYYIHSLKKAELEEKLLGLLGECPEWLRDRFVRDNLEG